MKSVKRNVILGLILTLVVIAFPKPAGIVNAQVITGTTVYLPTVSNKLSDVLPPYSVQIAGLSQITTGADFANLTAGEAAAVKENLIAELDVAFPSMLEAIVQSGAGYARVYIDWNAIEPVENGPYSWSFYDNRLPQLHEAGLGMIATVTNCPPMGRFNDKSMRLYHYRSGCLLRFLGGCCPTVSLHQHLGNPQ